MAGYGFRGETIARPLPVLGQQLPPRPCLCGEPIVPGDPIVKRWSRWIHSACYAEISAAKRDVGRR
jgi:hypothetical protein